MSAHLSTLKLHQYRYDELDAAARAEVTGHLDACARCRRRLQVQRAQREAFVHEALPPAIAAMAATEAPAPWWQGLRRWLAPVALAAAVGLAAAVPLLSGEDPTTPPQEITREKGAHEALEVWVATDAGPRKLRDGESLRAGDQVQLVFDPEGAPYVALAGRDGSGRAEIWRIVDTRDRPRGLRHAPFGLTLDDTPGDQVFVLLPLEEPLDEATLLDLLDGHETNGRAAVRVVVPKE